MLHIPLTNLLLLAAKQASYNNKKEAYLLTKSIEEFSGKKFRRTSRQKKDKIERVTGRRTRQEIAKWNQMTALRFWRGGRHQTSPERERAVSYTHLTLPTRRTV